MFIDPESCPATGSVGRSQSGCGVASYKHLIPKRGETSAASSATGSSENFIRIPAESNYQLSSKMLKKTVNLAYQSNGSLNPVPTKTSTLASPCSRLSPQKRVYRFVQAKYK